MTAPYRWWERLELWDAPDAESEEVERLHPRAMTIHAAREWMNAPEGVVVLMRETLVK